MEKWLVLQHTRDENPGTILDWFLRSQIRHEIQHIYLDDRLPSPEEFHTLVVLGGPMNVDEEDRYPWLRTEKRLIESALEAGNPILGLCLGGQLTAQVLGARVKKNKHQEIGWHEVHKSESKHPDFKHWPDSLPVFQWHEDHFALPIGAERIFTNSITEHQGYSFGDRVVGFQFHPESSQEWIERSIADLDERFSGPHVQKRAQVMAGTAENLNAMTENFHRFLDSFRNRTQELNR